MTVPFRFNRLSIFLFVCFCCVSSSLAQTARVAEIAPSQERSTQTVRETLERLQTLQAAIGREQQVPEAMRPLLTRLKHQLRDRISSALAEERQPVAQPLRVRNKLIGALKRDGVTVGSPKGLDWEKGYFYVESLIVERPARLPNYLAATTMLVANCLDDTSFYLFKHTGNGYELVLALEANDYDEVSGALGSFQYAVSPPDRDDGFFVLTGTITPWCQSNWQGFRYQVVRIGKDPRQPETVGKWERTIYLAGEVENRGPFLLAAGGNEFSVKYYGSQNLDSAMLTRLHIERYRLENGRPRRIEPIAAKPEDFLDEWLHLSWEEASWWISPTADAAKLRARHAELHRSEEDFGGEFTFIQPCPKPNQWQIGWSDKLPETYFTIIKKNGVFLMESIDKVRQPGCPGERSPYGP